MADDKLGSNLASSGAVVAALAAMGLYYFHREAPLLDMRPAADTFLKEQFASQKIEARLWQDPFAATEKSFDKSSKQDAVQKCLW